MTADLLRAAVASARRSAIERERRGVRLPDSPARPRHAFRDALAASGIRVIAECKRRSPSRGVLRRDYDPAAIAAAYAAAGAAAVSVLTEPTFFDGALDHLQRVRADVDVPVLRKDFIVTEFQIDEARRAGADAVLLIAGALDHPELLRLLAAAAQCGVDALVEVHDEDELARVLDAGATIVGVNCRNLRTLDLSLETFDRLADRLPAGIVAVAESGLSSAADLRRLHALRYDAFLIGERFMSAADPGAALAGLLAEARGGDTVMPTPAAKVSR
jgi:indole-3-glycerol phosphate synthase